MDGETVTRYGGWLQTYCMRSRRELTRCGPPSREFGEVLTTLTTNTLRNLSQDRGRGGGKQAWNFRGYDFEEDIWAYEGRSNGEWRRLHNEKFCDLYYSPNIIE